MKQYCNFIQELMGGVHQDFSYCGRNYFIDSIRIDRSNRMYTFSTYSEFFSEVEFTQEASIDGIGLSVLFDDISFRDDNISKAPFSSLVHDIFDAKYSAIDLYYHGRQFRINTFKQTGHRMLDRPYVLFQEISVYLSIQALLACVQIDDMKIEDLFSEVVFR